MLSLNYTLFYRIVPDVLNSTLVMFRVLPCNCESEFQVRVMSGRVK